MSVLAVPRSIARSFENRPCSQSKTIPLLSRVCPGGCRAALAPRGTRFYHRERSCLPRRPERWLGASSRGCGIRARKGRDQPFEILPSLCGKCFRHTGQNFLISNFSDIVRLFFVVV